MESTTLILDSPLFERFRALTVDVLELEARQIVPEAHFADDLGADSLDLVELVEAMEEEFDIRIDDEELAEVLTVGEAVHLIEAKVA